MRIRRGPRRDTTSLRRDSDARTALAERQRSPDAPIGGRFRRFTARHRRWYWPTTVAFAALAVAGVRQRVLALDSARDRWGASTTVWVATSDLQPGDQVAGNVRAVDMPLSVTPPSALSEPTGIIRQRVDGGTPLTAADTSQRSDDLALVPAGWGAIGVIENVPSGAVAGDHVGVISDGITIVSDALVLDTTDGVTRLAVPPNQSAALAVANANDDVTLIRWAAPEDMPPGSPLVEIPN